MRYFFLILSLMLAIGTGCEETPPTPPPPPVVVKDLPYYLNTFVDSVRSSSNIPGLAVGVIKDGEIVWNAGFGVANKNSGTSVDKYTRFMLNQAADPFVAVAVMQMLASENISLDTDINTLLPFSVKHPTFPNAVITPRMLLTHTAGIVDDSAKLASLYREGDAPGRLRDFLKSYLVKNNANYQSSNFTASRPGKTFEYSRIGISLAAYLVEAVTGVEFDLFCKTRYFNQLGYSSVSWFLNDLQRDKIATPYTYAGLQQVAAPLYGYPMYPSGQLRISVEYLARFGLAVMENGVYGDQQLLSAQDIQQLTKVQFPDIDAEQALGWRKKEAFFRLLTYSAGDDTGYTSRIYLDMPDHTGVVLLCNAENAGAALDVIANRIFFVSEFAE
ncbi:MAG: serine hydrolase [Bacteroidia bacterium]|nr:serine hydrolase [Bacteroidia bacterium]